MIDKIDGNLSFTSNIIFNKTLYKGFNQAIIDARTDKTKRATRFANAISYLKNDRRNDTYEIITKNSGYEPENNCYLVKNGKIIKKSLPNDKRLGENIMDVIINYVKIDLRHNLANETPIQNRTELNKINAELNEAVSRISKDLDTLYANLGRIKKFQNNISGAKYIINHIAELLSDKNMVEMGCTSNTESIVKKLHEIMGDAHYGKML